MAEFQQDYLAWWYTEVVKAFTKRSLTFPTDVLLAVAGLARQVEVDLSFTYLAGLWLEDINYSLIWQCCGQGIRNKDYTAPSWSWESMPFKILEPTFFNIYGFIYREPEGKYDATIIIHNTDTTSKGPFGQVESGHVRIRGYWRHVDRFADSPSLFFEHVADRRFLHHRS